MMGNPKRIFVFDGKEYTAEDLAVINNIAIHTVFCRASRNPNATFEELSAPAYKNNKPPLDMEKERMVIIGGELISLRDAAKKYGQDYRHLVYRYERGVRGDRLLKIFDTKESVGTAYAVALPPPKLPCGKGGHYTLDELLDIYDGCRDSEDVGIIMCDFTCMNYAHAEWLINELEVERAKRRMKK